LKHEELEAAKPKKLAVWSDRVDGYHGEQLLIIVRTVGHLLVVLDQESEGKQRGGLETQQLTVLVVLRLRLAA
jgi:hypothetical protein